MQDRLPISRSLISSYLWSPFRHVRQHIHKFWGLGHGHLCRGRCSGYHNFLGWSWRWVWGWVSVRREAMETGVAELGPWDQGMLLPERSLTKTLRRVYAIFQGRGDSCPLNHTRGHMAGHSPSQGCHPGLYHWRGIEKSSDRAEGVAWWFMSCHVWIVWPSIHLSFSYQ